MPPAPAPRLLPAFCAGRFLGGFWRFLRNFLEDGPVFCYTFSAAKEKRAQTRLTPQKNTEDNHERA